MAVPRIHVPEQRIAEFCRAWHLQEFSLFGSVLRDDFGPESDVDVLVVFQPGHSMTLEGFVAMREELTALFGREVDLVEKRLVKNPFRRHEILTNRQVLYAA